MLVAAAGAVVILVVGLVVVLGVVLGPDNDAATDAGQTPGAGRTPAGPDTATDTDETPETDRSPAPVATSPDSARRPQPPLRLRLPDGPLLDVIPAATTSAGLLDIPADVRDVGWWDSGSQVGDAFGAMVLAAHVDSAVQGLGPFADVVDAQVGQRFVADTGDWSLRYRVTDVQRIPRGSLTERGDLFAADGAHRMVLITCAGDFVPEAGGYTELAVVTAVPVTD